MFSCKHYEDPWCDECRRKYLDAAQDWSFTEPVFLRAEDFKPMSPADRATLDLAAKAVDRCSARLAEKYLNMLAPAPAATRDS